MRSKTNRWFETKVKCEVTAEDGHQKTVRETYVVQAFSFSEAEAAINKYMSGYATDYFEVLEEKIAPYHEIFFSDEPADEKYYKAHLQFNTVDEKTDKEKKYKIYYLVQARDIETARRYIEHDMQPTMTDYVILGINETRILDVFEHDTNAKNDH